MEHQYIISVEISSVDDGWYYTIWRRAKELGVFQSWDGGWIEDHGYTYDGAVNEVMLSHDIKYNEVFALMC